MGARGFPSEYTVVKPLGAGGFGTAYLVTDRATGAQQAIKELRPASGAERTQALAEAKHLAALRHPHIIQYIATLVKGSSVFIVMEYASRGNLWHQIEDCNRRGTSLEEGRVLRWTRQLTQALSFIHGKGLVHRDVKNTNCFLTADDSVRLGDFGTVRALDKNHAEVGQRSCRTPVGTPLYISPEICAGSRYTQSTDIWGLGCVVYELLTLRHPFFAASQHRLMEVIKRGRYDRRLPMTFSEGLRSLCHGCLTVDPAARPAAQAILDSPLFDLAGEAANKRFRSRLATQCGGGGGGGGGGDGGCSAKPGACAADERGGGRAPASPPPRKRRNSRASPASMGELSRAATKMREDEWRRLPQVVEGRKATGSGAAAGACQATLRPQPPPGARATPREAAILFKIRHAPRLGPETGAAVAALVANTDPYRPRAIDCAPLPIDCGGRGGRGGRHAPLRPLNQHRLPQQAQPGRDGGRFGAGLGRARGGGAGEIRWNQSPANLAF